MPSTGCICAVRYAGRQYRLATYLGARIVRCDKDGASIRQGKLALQVDLLDACPHGLRAPQMGDMARTVLESTVCKVRYRFTVGEETLFDIISPQASFEFSCPAQEEESPEAAPAEEG
jgi:hypothetical protein